ncbi:MAG TPA: S-methyl-5-thioribose-1-phosphate isomerase [Chthoniobacterales bacterium]
MKVQGKDFRTIWLDADGRTVCVIDQRRLPHRFEVVRWRSLADAAAGIKEMVVRGAPLIGVSAAYGLALAVQADPSDNEVARASDTLLATRPTAVNLRWALDCVRARLIGLPEAERATAAYAEAGRLAEEDVARCESIGRHGAKLIQAAWEHLDRARPVQILTHCNAGWLAAVDWGTALAPVYRAAADGVPVHVWVDETRPRNQGSSLTAWELVNQGVPHTVIADNTGGHLMQHGMVDLCIVGSDRTTARGDVCNKIGTYLKALAAKDNGVPFYAALPSSTIDWTLQDGVGEIPIEQRGAGEVSHLSGLAETGEVVTVQLTPEGSPVANYAFDVTPARCVTGIITEQGVCRATAKALAETFGKD